MNRYRGFRRRSRLWDRTAPMGVTQGTEVPTLFSWVSPDDQRDRAAYLQQIGQNERPAGAGEAGQGARTGHDEALKD